MESIVGSSVIFGVKKQDRTYKVIQSRELTATNDKLTRKELKTVQRKVQSDTKQHRRTYKNTVKKWKKYFK